MLTLWNSKNINLCQQLNCNCMMQIFLPSRTNHVMIKLQTLNIFSKDAAFAYLGYTCLYATVDNDCDHIVIEKYNV